MTTTLDRTALLHTSDTVISSEADGEIMLVSIDTGAYFGLDPVGSAIWRLAGEPVSFETISTALQAQFNGDPGQIDQDAADFVADLLAKGLLTQEMVGPAGLLFPGDFNAPDV